MIGSKIIEIALEEVGTTELPANSNRVKYNTWFYGKEVSGKNYPWCATFVSYVFTLAGLSLGNIGFSKGFAGTRTALEQFRKTKRTTFSPAIGDLAFFDWDLNGNVEHVGIFHKWLDKNYFESIEGNTAIENNSNGGEVMIRKRHRKFAKFVHPECLDV